MRRFLLPRCEYPLFRSRIPEDLLFAAAGTALGAGMGFLFFRSIAACLLLILPFSWAALRLGRHKTENRRREQMTGQLRDYLLSVISYLRAGLALENAMTGAANEIVTMYGADSMMGREAARMGRELILKTPPERIWRSFGDRTTLEDGVQLARIFVIAKRQGGDYLPVLKAFVRMMDARSEVRREIGSVLAGQQLEYSIMCLVPSGMLLFLDISSPEMTKVLYEGAGPLIMAGVLLAYVLAFLWGDRILEKSYGR
nr:type II secretion system F family protein [Lachnospiraceae bacterium]